jgi:hypothetical protein
VGPDASGGDGSKKVARAAISHVFELGEDRLQQTGRERAERLRGEGRDSRAARHMPARVNSIGFHVLKHHQAKIQQRRHWFELGR